MSYFMKSKSKDFERSSALKALKMFLFASSEYINAKKVV